MSYVPVFNYFAFLRKIMQIYNLASRLCCFGCAPMCARRPPAPIPSSFSPATFDDERDVLKWLFRRVLILLVANIKVNETNLVFLPIYLHLFTIATKLLVGCAFVWFRFYYRFM